MCTASIRSPSRRSPLVTKMADQSAHSDYPHDHGVPVLDGFCFFCEQRAAAEDYCYGCHRHVCEACDYRLDSRVGEHPVTAHMEGEHGHA